jgi:hypothetical protein
MNAKEARKLAMKALAEVIVGSPIIVSGPVTVADATALFKNTDGTWSVCDNGEEIVCHTEYETVRIITENLYHPYR